MKAKALTILFLIIALIFAPLCSADVGDVILAPVKAVEGLMWVPAIALMVAAVGPLVLLNQFEESVQKKMEKVFNKSAKGDKNVS